MLNLKDPDKEFGSFFGEIMCYFTEGLVEYQAYDCIIIRDNFASPKISIRIVLLLLPLYNLSYSRLMKIAFRNLELFLTFALQKTRGGIFNHDHYQRKRRRIIRQSTKTL